MKEGFITICICVILCVLGVGFMLSLAPVDNSVETVDNCEHDWVTTSEYSVWGRGYRTISKCSICGKVVK